MSTSTSLPQVEQDPRRYIVRWMMDGAWHSKRFGTAVGAEEYRDILRQTVDPNAYAVRS